MMATSTLVVSFEVIVKNRRCALTQKPGWRYRKLLCLGDYVNWDPKTHGYCPLFTKKGSITYPKTNTREKLHRPRQAIPASYTVVLLSTFTPWCDHQSIRAKKGSHVVICR